MCSLTVFLKICESLAGKGCREKGQTVVFKANLIDWLRYLTLDFCAHVTAFISNLPVNDTRSYLKVAALFSAFQLGYSTIWGACWKNFTTVLHITCRLPVSFVNVM